MEMLMNLSEMDLLTPKKGEWRGLKHMQKETPYYQDASWGSSMWELMIKRWSVCQKASMLIEAEGLAANAPRKQPNTKLR